MDVVAWCASLIAIDSINPFRAQQQPDGTWQIDGNEAAILATCGAHLRSVGWVVREQDCGGGRKNLIAEKGRGEGVLVLYAHVDTVEVKDGWTYEQALTPHRGVRWVDGKQEEVLIGLGANDMKGGVAVLMRVAAQIQPQHIKLRLILGCDEEFWSLGSHVLCQDPSLWEDVIGVMVPEVGESAVQPVAGSCLVTLGRCGRCELVVDLPGTGGHGAEPYRDDRVNAISQAARLALWIEEKSRGYAPFFPFSGSAQAVRSSALVTRIEGGMGTLSIPERARLIVNRVLVPGENAQQACSQMEQWIEEAFETGLLRHVERGGSLVRPHVSLRPRPTPPLLPYVASPEDPFVRTVLAALETHCPVEWGMGVSVADENRFGGELHKPVVVLGPRGEEAHAPFEWVSIPSLLRLETLYLSAIAAIDQPSSVR